MPKLLPSGQAELPALRQITVYKYTDGATMDATGRTKVFLVKGDKRFLVLSFDKGSGALRLRGEMTTFTTNVNKAIRAGYKMVKET